LTVLAQPCGLNTRTSDGGFLASLAAGLRGRGTNSPPQLGHLPPSFVSTHDAQNVHSKEQMRASVESGGRSLLQHSQLGRSSSTWHLLHNGLTTNGGIKGPIRSGHIGCINLSTLE